MKRETITYQKSPCHILSFHPREIRLSITEGIPNKRERIQDMYGNPALNEVVAFRQNCTFFNTKDPKSEVMGAARGDTFTNFAYDGSKIYIEPFENKDLPRFIWETPGGYSLIRNGIFHYHGEAGLKSILGSNPRSMFGQKQDGTLVSVIAEGRLFGKGLTSQEQRNLGHSLGVHNFMNLDGGGSSVAYYYDTRIGKSYDGRSLGRILIGYAGFTLSQLPILKRGSQGVWVNLLQRHSGCLVPDGKFGPATEKWVKQYATSGVVTPAVWKKILKVEVK